MAQTYVERAGGRRRVRTVSGINLLIGAWLILSPAVFITTGVSFWNNLIVGIAVFLFAGLRVMMPRVGTRGLSWLNVLLGVWLIFSPYILDYSMSSIAWNDLIVGLVLVAAGWWSARRPRPAEMSAARRR